jgi:hypothetical protein
VKRARKTLKMRPDVDVVDYLGDLIGFGRARQVVTLAISGVDIAVSVGAPGAKAKEIGRGVDLRAAVSQAMGAKYKSRKAGIRTTAPGRSYKKRPCERSACGKQFMPTGPRALYCSSRCRKLDGQRNSSKPPVMADPLTVNVDSFMRP